MVYESTQEYVILNNELREQRIGRIFVLFRQGTNQYLMDSDCLAPNLYHMPTSS